MYDAVLVTAGKIKRLEIQGARNVAIEAIKSLENGTKQSTAKTKQEFLKELSEAKKVLFASRSTEPFMRNAISFVIQAVDFSSETNVSSLVENVSKVTGEYGSRVLTHCHSSTVMKILKQAKSDGKQFELFCTESRPVFQGRITAKEMVEAGIKTTMFVDSAVRHFINEVDFVVVGADAITSEGNVINKIGTSMIALAAKEARTPFYVATELLKFDPATIFGHYEKIEERNPQEVWDSSPEGLVIENPAFDVTRREFIHGIICEEGIVAPDSVNELISRKYPWILQK
ncbi:MAG: S-methyl-5-thioribose-1-phosphate isomerase [Candidatus Bathyarchaeota archaeon]